MKRGALLLFMLASVMATDRLAPGFRPPSVPLIVMDPYMSFWSRTTFLYDSWPCLWDGQTKSLGGLIRVDGKVYRFMGAGSPSLTAEQLSVQVFPTTTVYTFAAGNVQLTLKFVTPTVPQDIKLLSQPITYIVYEVNSTDGQSHQVEIYYDQTSEIVVQNMDEAITWSRGRSSSLTWLRMGTKNQKQFEPVGDGVAINWGYSYLAVKNDKSVTTSIASSKINRGSFIRSGGVPNKDDSRQPRPANDQTPTMAVVFSLLVTPMSPVSKHLMFAYDDINSIKWYGTPFPPLWKTIYNETVDMLEDAEMQFDQRMDLTSRLDKAVLDQTFAAGGVEYSTIASLVWRQTFGAHKLVYNTQKNTTWYFLKEISSNGDFSTVDVLFPAIPLLLWTNPKLAELIVLPHLSFSNYETPVKYDLPWAPHQLGVWPVADATTNSQEHMPVEETGNLLLIIEWLATFDKDSTSQIYPAYKDVLDKWAQYLISPGQNYTGDVDVDIDRNGNDLPNMPIPSSSVQQCKSECMKNEKCKAWSQDTCGTRCWLKSAPGEPTQTSCKTSGLSVPVAYTLGVLPDPGSQLCTDDFLGPIPHNVNLAAKGIIALDGYSRFLRLFGRESESTIYTDTASRYAQWWMDHGVDTDGHCKLRFDVNESFSIQYNLVFQRFLNLSTFPSQVLEDQVKYYLSQQFNTYGVPLNSNAAKNDRAFTKLDWLSWAGSMTENEDTASAYWKAIYSMAHETANRVPLTDWYDTNTAGQVGFQARPVVGGFYAWMLLQPTNRLAFEL